MKKILALLLASLLVISLFAGCAKQTNDTMKKDEQPAANGETAKENMGEKTDEMPMDAEKPTLGGQDVFLYGGVAKLADGTLAGSATNLYDCMRKAVEFGIPKEQAILSATLIPARELGCENEIGSIAPGKRADFVMCDEEVNRKTVFLCGKPLKNSVAENNKGRNLNTEIQRGGI